MIHIIPINDLKEHELSSTCSCEPYLIKQEGSELILVHNSFDGREGLELAQTILDNDQ